MRRTGGRNTKYGSWRSPLSPDMLAGAGVKPGFVQVDGEDAYWQETRPAEDGRTVLVRRRADGAVEDVAAPVRTLVHEYGGRAFAVRGGRLAWSDFSDQRLYRGLGAPVTREPPTPHGVRFADHELTHDGRWVVCVRETHGEGEPVNEVVAVPLDGGEPVVLAAGCDFFMAPRVRADGARLAWLAWDHPNMPWDAAELWVADLGPDMAVVAPRRLAGGDGVSALQPLWAPDGALHWADDRTGWWNLYRDGEPLAALDAEVGYPGWQFGFQSHTVLRDGTVVAVITGGGTDRLAVLRDGAAHDVPQPFTMLSWVEPHRDGVVAVAASADRDASVVHIAIPSGDVEVLRSGLTLDLEPGWISHPESVSFPTAGGATAHALVYPPRNPEHEGPEGERPPVIVLSHGGPTAAASTALDLDIQFWTTRGFAVADVNYRGSTGYGRAYRDALRGLWGIADVEDCVACVEHLAGQGRVDGRRAVIRGWSAGGYTTLAALTTTDAFAAGASHYGVGDLGALAQLTHKFEARYLDSLIGPWPEAKAVYDQRSPINHVDGFSAPVILFQGLEDQVVPPEQARAIAAALERKGLEHELVLFEGEDHGFRRAETKRRVAEAELAFLGRVLGFAPAG